MLCGFLATPLSGRPLQQFVVAGILLAVGAVLWVVNRLVVGRVDVDPTHLDEGVTPEPAVTHVNRCVRTAPNAAVGALA